MGRAGLDSVGTLLASGVLHLAGPLELRVEAIKQMPSPPGPAWPAWHGSSCTYS